MKDITHINRKIKSTATVLNSKLNKSSETLLNSSISEKKELKKGTVIFGKYRITEKIMQSAGEADLYLCEYMKKRYVLKAYSRENAIKPEVVRILEKISSPYVAKLYHAGKAEGKTVEIIQYFRNGSVKDKTFTFEELKTFVIPSINEGLRTLHSFGIIHKDIKPSNIMLNDDGKSVSIIDFGISSVESGDSTVIVTETGMTPEYSAPESFRGLFLEESDYYSMGVTLYELFCGNTPYKNLSPQQIAQYTSLQKIPLPKDMPQELKNLICGLTYYDITNRNDKSNPDRRWTYYEVLRWCRGEKVSVPGEKNNGYAVPAYRFMGREYRNIRELVNAFSLNWEEGKKQLFRGLMSAFFRNFDPQTAGYCIDAEEETLKGSGNDIIFFRLLYKLVPNMTSFNWKGRVYSSLSELGTEIVSSENLNADTAYYSGILENKVLSEYFLCVHDEDEVRMKAVKTLEDSFLLEFSERKRKVLLYTMGYMLSERKILKVNGKEFSDISQLVSYISSSVKVSFSEFEKICSELIQPDNRLTVQFESWLIVQGKSEEVRKWEKKLSL